MSDDFPNTRTDSVIGDGSEEEQIPVDTDRDDISDPHEEEVVVGDPVANDEPKELDEEAPAAPEYEPLEPDEPA